MADALRLLATVSHHQAESAADDLEAIADQQESNLKKKEQLRDTEKLYDSITADGIVTFDELVSLHEMREWVGTTDESFWNEQGRVRGFESAYDGQWHYDETKVPSTKHGNNSHWYMDMKAEGQAGAEVKELMENLKDEITAAKEGVDDDQSQVQFQIQVGTSDLQNAENVRSQAEKRLETQRKDLTRNWGG
jgi:hypothetical protein